MYYQLLEDSAKLEEVCLAVYSDAIVPLNIDGQPSAVDSFSNCTFAITE